MMTEDGDGPDGQSPNENNAAGSRSRQEIERIETLLNSDSMKRMRQSVRQTGTRIVPRNAASIILLRGEPGREEIIMGRRNRNLKFMPGALVFPGGRVDRGDWRVPTADPLRPEVRAKVMAGLPGNPGGGSAHALGVAALRELFEETGFLIGRAADHLPRGADWATYRAHGIAPSLNGLRLLARAITPPGMPRRFDTWFFVTRLDDRHLEPDEGFVHSSELEELRWIRPEEAIAEDTREITRVMLVELMNRLRADPDLDPATPIPSYTTVRDRFHRKML